MAVTLFAKDRGAAPHKCEDNSEVIGLKEGCLDLFVQDIIGGLQYGYELTNSLLSPIPRVLSPVRLDNKTTVRSTQVKEVRFSVDSQNIQMSCINS
jgi:hypothetical protein